MRYVHSESVLVFSAPILSLETCLGNQYSEDISQDSKPLLERKKADSEIITRMGRIGALRFRRGVRRR